jgi:hypothetical protein
MEPKIKRIGMTRTIVVQQNKEEVISEDLLIKLEAGRAASELLSNRIRMNSALSCDEIVIQYPRIYDMVLKQLKK